MSTGTLASSITATNKFKNQTIKIPTNSENVNTSSSNTAIPLAAALSAAAAAGIGTKAFLDRKENNSVEDDEEEFSEGEENKGLFTENWEGDEEDIKIDYGMEEEQTLDDEDDYSYSADAIIEKYEAVNNSELEAVQ